MKRNLECMSIEELFDLSVDRDFLDAATNDELAAVRERLAFEWQCLRGRPVWPSRRFGTRLRLRPARTQNENRLVFEQPWHRSLTASPGQRKPFARRATVEELRARVGTGCEDCDRVVSEIVDQRERPRTALMSRLRRRSNLSIDGLRLRIDDPAGRMNAWGYRGGDRRKIQLSQAQIDRVLAANGLPVPPFGDQGRDMLQPKYQHLTDTEVAQVLARGEIGLLTWRLSDLGIHAPFPRRYTKRKLADHERKLSERLEALKALLFDETTDLIWSPRPAGRLAYLRQELSDFCDEVRAPSAVADSLRLLGSMGNSGHGEHSQPCQSQSALESFIDKDLRHAFEFIYNRECKISRKPDGPAYGEFITFVQVFFTEAGFRTPEDQPFPSVETIARALRPHQRALNGARPGARRSRLRNSPN
jgi:hypothetical protein